MQKYKLTLYRLIDYPQMTSYKSTVLVWIEAPFNEENTNKKVLTFS